MAIGGDERRRLRKTILKYEDDPLGIELSGQQDKEMKRLVMAIEERVRMLLLLNLEMM